MYVICAYICDATHRKYFNWFKYIFYNIVLHVCIIPSRSKYLTDRSWRLFIFPCFQKTKVHSKLHIIRIRLFLILYENKNRSFDLTEGRASKILTLTIYQCVNLSLFLKRFSFNGTVYLLFFCYFIEWYFWFYFNIIKFYKYIKHNLIKNHETLRIDLSLTLTNKIFKKCIDHIK